MFQNIAVAFRDMETLHEAKWQWLLTYILHRNVYIRKKGNIHMFIHLMH